jgi:hypothetical protein
VYNGDDSLSMKADSTDISITNSKFYNGLGIAMGSIGQYNGQLETIERITVNNVEYDNTLHAVGDSFYVWPSDYSSSALTQSSFLSSTSKHGQPTRTAIHLMEVAADLDVSFQ